MIIPIKANPNGCMYTNETDGIEKQNKGIVTFDSIIWNARVVVMVVAIYGLFFLLRRLLLLF
jgi:hypothetical protein